MYRLLLIVQLPKQITSQYFVTKSTPARIIKNIPYLVSNGFAGSTLMDSTRIFDWDAIGEKYSEAKAKYVR